MYRLVVCLASIPLLYSAPSAPSEPVVGSTSVPPEPIVDTTSVQPLAGSLWNLRQVNKYGEWYCFVCCRCCMHHDNCYRAAVDNKFCRDTALEYVLVYNWQCTNSTATCLDAEGTCKRALCDCDTAVVNCWAKQPRPKRKLRCNRTRPAPTSCYNNYGCWCGIGGSHEPIDEIDKCCMLHDKCYDAAVDNKLCLDVAWEYIDIYNWQCTNNTATCLDAEGTCKRALCDCDTAVVNCWAQHPKPNRKLKCNRSRLAPKSIYFQH
ncbi:unnamed protein product [Haemonchus placei]|uniref:Phospholipase A2 n=1 Tax=Haemonchus placei TaxID=6290 RepID=A0A0N4WVH8_HAEPC|nr:unnamed protein product [Haemonchus placei]